MQSPAHPHEKKSAEQNVYPWMPDQGDGTFRNPVIHADYSDPDVIRVGDDFYLIASSFNCTPGLPVLHSKDLVNWTIIGHALKNLPHPRFAEVQPGCGVWAPAIRFHAGKFWIFFPMPDEGIYVITASHPAGEWSPPQLVQAGQGLIDPCPFWDDDGKAWLVHAYAESRSGIKDRLRVRQMAVDGSRLLGEGTVVYHQPQKHPIIEGPKFLKRDGWYYIFAPAGGVENGWQVVLRSRKILGPYEDKIVLAQGTTRINGPHQGAFVDTAAGEWWFVHFQDAGVYGRITHLQPVQWRDGWPLTGENQNKNGTGEPVLCHVKPRGVGKNFYTPQTSDEFDGAKLGRQWQWQANHADDWFSLAARESRLRLFPQLAAPEDIGRLPNVLAQKFPATAFTVETLLEFSPGQAGEEAGLVVTGGSTASFALERSSSTRRLVLRFNGVEKFARNAAPSIIKLRMTVQAGGVCQFSFADESHFTSIPEMFQATKGAWLGAKVGLYALKRTSMMTKGFLEVDYFRFSK